MKTVYSLALSVSVLLSANPASAAIMGYRGEGPPERRNPCFDPSEDADENLYASLECQNERAEREKSLRSYAEEKKVIENSVKAKLDLQVARFLKKHNIGVNEITSQSDIDEGTDGKRYVRIDGRFLICHFSTYGSAGCSRLSKQDQ